MGDTITVRRVNKEGTLAVTLPAPIARMIDVHEGTQFDLSVFATDALMLRRIKEERR